MSHTTPSTPEAGSAPDYKKTLNLPKTSFPMKANLVQNEPASIKRWREAGVYDAVRAARKGAAPFVFHDGPPYANGDIHLGHLLNKTLKDLVVRTRTMSGLDCPYVPGWDCHGLPIEHKVMGDLIAAKKMDKISALPDDQRRMAVRRECQSSAEKFIKLQAGQMQRLLTLADYDHPYMTMAPAYEGATLELFAALCDEGLVYRQRKPVHWSIANRTALAEAELEYQDREDVSVYVDFELDDAATLFNAFNLTDHPDTRPSLMIWTTTPWTLPANLAIAAHPRFEYALVQVDGALTVIAADLVERVTKLAKAEDVRVLATTTGERLLGLQYRHPFVDSAALAHSLRERERLDTDPALHRVVLADYVTLEDGTGLVHTAPGHGNEDYQTGVRESLPIYCPVREDGTYDDTVPEWLRAVSVWDANTSVTERLRASGHLFFDHVFTHSYPHDWRSKTPVIFRATEQWFVGVDNPLKSHGKSMRRIALDAASKDVRFVPEWGRNRLRGMLESRPDWCISRQRAWGLPIPAFHFTRDDGTEDVLLTPASVRAVVKVVREKGSDAWFTMTPAELLRGYDPAHDAAAPGAPGNVRIDALRKGGDIFDVWFESGSSWHAVMRERGLGFPVELYLEGSDQHRGWFQLSMLCGIGATGRSPFNTLLTHGFMVDKDGRKMSKSLGNALNVDDLMKNYGADVCRWWVATLSYENDIKVDPSFFETAGEAYRKVRNTLRFMLSNLDDFTPSPPGKDCSSGEGMCVPLRDYPPTSIDAWALAQCDALSNEVRAAYDRYDFRAASTLLYNFCNDTLSAVYLAAVKDRLYCDRLDSARRRRTQSTLWDLTDALTRLLAPIMPHTADEAHRALHKVEPNAAAPDRCVHLLTFATPFDAPCDADAWARAMSARDAALRALEQARASGVVENPLDAWVTLPDPDGALARFDAADLADLLGVSNVLLDAKATAPAVADARDKPKCDRSWKRDGTVRKRSDGGTLSDRDAAAVGVA